MLLYDADRLEAAASVEHDCDLYQAPIDIFPDPFDDAVIAQLHGWHCVIEDDEVHVLDVPSGRFVPASMAEHRGDGPFDIGRVFS